MRYLVFSMCMFIFACSNNSSVTNEELHRIDSIRKVNLRKSVDSLIESSRLDSIAILKAKKVSSLKLGDKAISQITGIQQTSILRYEYEYTEYNTYFRERKSERDEVYLFVKFKLTSESKWDGVDVDFLPKLCLFTVDKKSNYPILVGKMDLQVAVKDDSPANVIEGIFNYKESVDFIAWAIVKKPAKEKYIITANKGTECLFNRNGIIAKLNF